jgi:amidase
MVSTSDLLYGSAVSMAKLIRGRALSVREVISAHIEQIESVNSSLNAVFQIDKERVFEEALQLDRMLERGEVRGPLHGVPITIKDSLDTAGIISTWGTSGRRDFIPGKDATVVDRLRRAGAIILGKSNTSELTMGGEMDNVIYGPTNNPYDLSKSPSGSSGGAAAIVAAGGSALDLGSDTGGSIRSPAHVCGIAGIKPTYGRTSRTGHAVTYGMGVLDMLTQIGPLSRCVEDLILTLPLICGPDKDDPSVVPMPLGDAKKVNLENLRMAFYTDGGIYPPISDLRRIVRNTATALAHRVTSATEAFPEALSRSGHLYPWLKFMDKGNSVRSRLQEAGSSTPGPYVARLLNEAESADIPDLSTVFKELGSFQSEMHHFLQDYDVIICPVDVYPAMPHGNLNGDTDYSMWAHMSAYNLTGWPAGVVRAGETSEGLPVGVQVVGHPWREDVVLAVMMEIERIFGGYIPPGTRKTQGSMPSTIEAKL